MTQQRIRRLQTKLQEARCRLLETQPMFALLLMHLRFVAVAGMRKISTNGRSIFFSAEYVDKLYGYELEFVLCHVLMHIVTGDIWRERDLRGDDYHLACDIQNNALMMSIGFPDTRYPHLGAVQHKVPGNGVPPQAITKEQIRALQFFSLYAFEDRVRNRYLPDDDRFWSDRTEWTCDGTLILDVPEVSPPGPLPDYGQAAAKAGKAGIGGAAEDGEDLRQIWQSRIAAAEKTAERFAASQGERGTLAGVVPGHMKRRTDGVRTKQVDWKKVLQEYLQEEVCDYSFSPPDRRFADTGFFLPDFNETAFQPLDVLFMVDTSGSVDRRSLSVVYGEIKGALEQFAGKLEGKLGFFDTEVTEPVPFSSISALEAIVPMGGGGTDFAPIFEYIRQSYRSRLPSCVVIFTDGYGPFPEEKEVPAVPVLWLISNSTVDPPFGRVARFRTRGAREED